MGETVSNEGAQGKGSPTDFLTDASGIGADPGSLAQKGPPGQPSGEGEGSQKATDQKLPGFTAAATKELKADPKFTAWASKFKNFDEAVKRAMELEENLVAGKEPPGSDVGQRVPKDISEYILEHIEGVQYGDGNDDDFRAMAKNLNLTINQAKGIFEYASKKSLEVQSKLEQQEKDRSEAIAAERDKVEKTLKSEWGASYDQNKELLKRGFRSYVPDSLAKKMRESGLGNNIDLIRLITALGKTVQEDPGAFSRTFSVTSEGRPQLEYPGL